ncbi:putative class I SAM-dependent methyltransferase [Monocercomonoides exilis]|uniref:putative class I SAM-dependent methyltransferase n=1 Tax=Monocercomonoides exilis TaxID=2049356 RepID=UPI003559F0C4|nr:putative class I SAM-dependent methyltransferase [Monocercomonoides exilis]|eukprot:MONOS_12687.1-p1 / transcript=MONOS_12687.1 / gene=MONOS_12687 / organism=Monocercomonoides_exilis_PA203 / gene_product=methyltransferase / transcript_product=methyltransferase / location=Mono_scaffold00719:12891-13713(-) / protein_length=256 / sequence_SO=supercontig / SO=protein_coding / is_pseudo=false
MINDFPEDQLSVADIGTGSGEVIFPAIEKVGCPIEITTVEPSLAFHSKLVSTFEQLKSQSKIADVHCFNNKAQNLWEEKSLLKDISEKKFDIIQATFSIQNLSKAEDRKSFFLWAKQHLNTKAQLSLSSASPSAPQKTGQLIVIEFDVPESGSNQLPLCRSDRVNFFREAYEKGIGEYRNTPAFMPVTQGFLIPVLLSKFDEDILKDSIETESTSIEQSKEKWAQEMREAGFSRVETCYLAPFWWSNCVAIIGTV